MRVGGRDPRGVAQERRAAESTACGAGSGREAGGTHAVPGSRGKQCELLECVRCSVFEPQLGVAGEAALYELAAAVLFAVDDRGAAEHVVGECSEAGAAGSLRQRRELAPV